jgi:hypothetical protein
MNDLTLDIFGPTICTRWNSQSSKLKDELINKLVGLFGEGSFNKSGVSSKAGAYLKYCGTNIGFIYKRTLSMSILQ